ncbi:Hypothetical predicted protein [Mytilus galloprovincialis]|uniref:Uncharacterized protein n=1 Tax=Mytilus galloprovincialis TaxID=29158 RepID=A0A8B6HGI2_MYTGA|nr:Hypothetical predicted protein [Mytilus galloprovincialis]
MTQQEFEISVIKQLHDDTHAALALLERDCPLSLQDLDVMKIHALLEEEPRGSYKVNYIVTERGRIIELQYDNKFTINLGEFKLLKKYRVYDEKMSLPSHALCFESAPFPLTVLRKAIGLFKSPPVVAINTITNLPDHQRIFIRGEIARIPLELEPAEGAENPYRGLRLTNTLMRPRSIKVKLWREKASMTNGFSVGDKIVVKNLKVMEFRGSIFLNSMSDTNIMNDTEFQETVEGLVIGASFVRDELSIYIEDFGMVTTSFEQMSNIFATNAFEEGIILRCAVNNGELTYIGGKVLPSDFAVN